ncbi:MAG: hypothetical protein DYG99_02675 [Bacteroidetes bacterium CHB5]|nr:hypothetical protein [Bacteroidetes bacterium CHB5]
MSRVILLIFILVSCNAAKPQATINPQHLAEVVLGKGLQEFYNESKTHILFVQQATAYPNQPIKFLIIEKASGKALFEKSFRPGYVKWLNNNTIEYEDLPGSARQNEGNYIKTWTIPPAAQAH